LDLIVVSFHAVMIDLGQFLVNFWSIFGQFLVNFVVFGGMLVILAEMCHFRVIFWSFLSHF